MVKDLTTLLRESAAHPPSDHGAASDLTELVRHGRSRVRRRRAAVVGGAVASVAAVAVAGVLLSGGLGGAGVVEPARQLAPVGPVVHPSDAQPGIEGRDHDVLTTYTNDNLDRANGTYLSGMTPDGMVLVQDGPHGVDNVSRWGLLDPATDETDWLRDPPSVLEVPLSLEEHRLLFLSYANDRAAVVIHDRDSGGWSVPLEVGAKSWAIIQAQMGPDNRVYFTRDIGSGTHAELWSRSLDSPDEKTRDEGLTVGEFVIAGGQLVYSATHNEPNDRITVRDLATGRERSFDPESGDACNQLSMQVAGDHLVLGQYCGTTNGGTSPVRDDRAQVIDLDGNPVVTIQGNGLEARSVSQGGFVVGVYGRVGDRDGATYTWSFNDGKLRQVADSVSTFTLPWLAPEVGPAGSDVSDVVMWHEAVNDQHGARQVVARLR